MRHIPLVLALALLGTNVLPGAAAPGAEGTAPLGAGDAPDPVQAAVDAYNKGRHIEAVRLARPLAGNGNPAALVILGLAHETGRGAEPSRELAIKNYRLAHEAGSGEASFRLATSLIAQGGAEEQAEAKALLETLSKDDTGQASRILGEGSLRGWFGDEADFDKTRFYWQQAADKGDVTAIMTLARLLDGKFGFAGKRDPAAALAAYAQAAQLGNPAAMVAVGSRLLNGEEELRNEKRGREWLAKAIAKENYEAHLALGDFEEVVKKDDRAALAQYRKGAGAGQAACMLKLATFISDGRGGEAKDPKEALAWFKRAGKAGNPLGHVQAATVLLKGEGLQIVEGYAHLVAAAEGGLADIQNEVGLLYLSGRLGIRDATAAAGWFGRSATAGYPQGAHNLGTLYEQGLGVPRNLNNAGRLYLQAAKAGHPQATTALGRLHASGAGIQQDLAKAWALFSIAVERGDEGAKALLGELTSQLTDDQLAEGRKALAELKDPPAKDGGSPAPGK
jgi:TPR repeat protein